MLRLRTLNFDSGHLILTPFPPNPNCLLLGVGDGGVGTDLIFLRCRPWEKFQNLVSQGAGG